MEELWFLSSFCTILLISHVALFAIFRNPALPVAVDPPAAHLGCGDAHAHRAPEAGQCMGWGCMLLMPGLCCYNRARAVLSACCPARSWR